MPEPNFTVRQGDNFTIVDTLEDSNGNPVDIESATVEFTWLPIDGDTAEVDDSASNDQNGDGSDGSTGSVSYSGGTADTAASGFKLANWKVTFADDTVQTFPNAGYILVQVTPTAPASPGELYITVEELKAARELSGYTYADADIPRAINAACRSIDKTCRRRFWADADNTSVRYYSPTNHRRVWVDDIIDLTSVEVDESGDGNYNRMLTEGKEFVLSPENASEDGEPWYMLSADTTFRYCFPTCYRRSVKVTAQFGWSEVPDAVHQAALILAIRYLTRSKEAPFGVLTVGGVDGSSSMRISRTDPDVYELLKPYLRVQPAI